MKVFKTTQVEDPSEGGPFDAPIAPTTAGDIFFGFFLSLFAGILVYYTEQKDEQKKNGQLAPVDSHDDKISQLVPVDSNDDKISQLTIKDLSGKTVATLSGLSLTRADFLAGLGNPSIGNPSDPAVTYPFMVSLLDGKLKVIGGGLADRNLEVGAGGKATVESGKGDDKLFVWHQKTVDFDGGKGIDAIQFRSNYGDPYATPFKQQLVVDLDKGNGQNPYGGSLKLNHVESVVGTSQADKISGDDHANVIGDGAFDVGADTIKARGGSDVVKIAPGSHGGVHADGGKGIDELQFDITLSTTAEGTTILDLEHPEKNTGPMTGSVFKNFEKFTAQNAGGYLHHLDFRGSGADETVTGTSGFYGPAGSAGRDFIDGRGGDDRLDGNAGNDQLTGGPGRDTFVFDTVLNAASNMDTITDFSGDRIELNQFVFAGIGTPGKLAAKYFSGEGVAHTAEQHVIYDPSTGKLFYDADGAGGTPQVQFAYLSNHGHLTNSDFVVA